MSATDVTVTEIIESLTGFDELAIEKQFPGLEVYSAEGKQPVKLVRALVFIHKRREGATDREAYKSAMELPVGQCQDYFADDEETDDEQPVTESGKEG